jgi:hypothetical protein
MDHREGHGRHHLLELVVIGHRKRKEQAWVRSRIRMHVR